MICPVVPVYRNASIYLKLARYFSGILYANQYPLARGEVPWRVGFYDLGYHLHSMYLLKKYVCMHVVDQLLPDRGLVRGGGYSIHVPRYVYCSNPEVLVDNTY